MHLILTSVGDVTSDFLCESLGDRVLRVNVERWRDYELEISCSGFRIADQFGREFTHESTGNIIWRKPMPDIDPNPGEEWYSFHEYRYGIDAIVEWVRSQDHRRIPIDPLRNRRADKIRQLRAAARHLPVPRWNLTTQPGKNPCERPLITKSMTSRPIPGTGEVSKIVYTSAVTSDELCEGFPWFLQELYPARYDLTIVFVDGKQFGFLLDRELFEHLDWRRTIGRPTIDSAWQRVPLPSSLTTAIAAIMSELDLRFGRVDLLTNDVDCSDARFLEVNPNGQWAWLDPTFENGLYDAVLEFLVR